MKPQERVFDQKAQLHCALKHDIQISKLSLNKLGCLMEASPARGDE